MPFYFFYIEVTTPAAVGVLTNCLFRGVVHPTLSALRSRSDLNCGTVPGQLYR